MQSNKLVFIILFATMFVLTFYSRSFFADELSTIEKSVLTVQEENVKQLSRVIEAEGKINKVPWLISRFIYAESTEKKKYIEGQIISQIQEIEDEYISGFHYRDDAAPLYKYVEKNWAGYKETVLQILRSDKGDKFYEAQDRMENSLLYLERVNDGMRMIVTFHERDVEEKTDSIVYAVQKSQANVLILTVIINITFFCIGLLAFRKITSTENKLRAQAYHDTLTGLPNRLSFQQALAYELSGTNPESDKGAVVFLDMDNFKMVNDSYGHDVGDKFLKVIADRIKLLLSDKVFAARFGGDEFVLMLRGADEQRMPALLQELLAHIAVPVQIEGVVLYPTPSMGIAFYPDHGTSVIELLKKADVAMYQAKANKSDYVIYKYNGV